MSREDAVNYASNYYTANYYASNSATVTKS